MLIQNTVKNAGRNGKIGIKLKGVLAKVASL